MNDKFQSEVMKMARLAHYRVLQAVVSDDEREFKSALVTVENLADALRRELYKLERERRK